MLPPDDASSLFSILHTGKGVTVFEPYAAEAQFALQAVRAAARLCRRIQEERVAPAMTKADRSPVTVADFASQALIGRMLIESFPQDPLMAEEGSAALRTREGAETLRVVTEYLARLHPEATPESVCRWIDHGTAAPAGRFWVLDPIDGTKGFLRGEQYVVALALIERGEVVLGALGAPNLGHDLRPQVGGAGCALLAVRGRGSWATPLVEESLTRLQVSRRSEPQRARLLRSVESGHTDVAKIEAIADALGTREPPVLMDSQAKFALIAGGRAELILRLLSPHNPDYSEKIWDQAAGSIIVEEAGGRVTDLRGQPLDFAAGRELRNNLGVLVSNGLLHQVALQAVRAVGADRRPEAA